jgi:2,3-bisphosphoglycerate-independent phosphoglycerate mutase
MKKCEEEDITLLLTADHGNRDTMVYPDGKPHTSHTGAPVPFCVFHPKLKDQKGELSGQDFALMDVSPTVLHVLGIEQAPNFEGQSIFK